MLQTPVLQGLNSRKNSVQFSRGLNGIESFCPQQRLQQCILILDFTHSLSYSPSSLTPAVRKKHTACTQFLIWNDWVGGEGEGELNQRNVLRYSCTYLSRSLIWTSTLIILSFNSHNPIFTSKIKLLSSKKIIFYPSVILSLSVSLIQWSSISSSRFISLFLCPNCSI